MTKKKIPKLSHIHLMKKLQAYFSTDSIRGKQNEKRWTCLVIITQNTNYYRGMNSTAFYLSIGGLLDSEQYTHMIHYFRRLLLDLEIGFRGYRKLVLYVNYIFNNKTNLNPRVEVAC